MKSVLRLNCPSYSFAFSRNVLRIIMANSRLPVPTLLVVAAFSRHENALEWGRQRLSSHFGPIALQGAPFDFNHTKYYETEMGCGLKKELWAFQQLISEDQLASVKVLTNLLELELADNKTSDDPRPLNLDPGVLTLGKFSLATTKDQAHRVYLRDGIYAEVTLRFQDGQFEPWPWTYADYREPHVRATLKEFRTYYRKQLQAQAG